MQASIYYLLLAKLMLSVLYIISLNPYDNQLNDKVIFPESHSLLVLEHIFIFEWYIICVFT